MQRTLLRELGVLEPVLPHVGSIAHKQYGFDPDDTSAKILLSLFRPSELLHMFDVVADRARRYVHRAISRGRSEDARIEIDLRSEINPAAANRFADVLEARRLGVGSVVAKDDEPTAAFDQRVQARVVEVAAIGQVAIVSEIIRL